MVTGEEAGIDAFSENPLDCDETLHAFSEGNLGGRITDWDRFPDRRQQWRRMHFCWQHASLGHKMMLV